MTHPYLQNFDDNKEKYVNKRECFSEFYKYLINQKFASEIDFRWWTMKMVKNLQVFNLCFRCNKFERIELVTYPS